MEQCDKFKNKFRRIILWIFDAKSNNQLTKLNEKTQPILNRFQISLNMAFFFKKKFYRNL